MSAGVRNLDGMADGHSGSVRQCPRHCRSPSAHGRGVAMPTGHRPCSPCLAGVVACGSSGSGRVSGCGPHEVPCPRWLPQGPLRVRAGGRRTVGGWTPVQGVRPPRTPAWPPSPACPRVPNTCRPDAGRSGSSGRSSIRRSFWLVTTSSTLPQGRPCGRPPPAAALGRQRHHGHREAPSSRLWPSPSGRMAVAYR
jgi:hypothetical protein